MKTTTSPPTKNILILGASYSGLQLAHYLLKHILPSLPSPSSYTLTIINPSSHFYHVVSAPRGIISDSLIDPTQASLDIASGLQQYGDRVRFIQGSVTSVDTTSRRVAVDNGIEIEYFALIFATGAKTHSPLYSQSPERASAVAQFREQLTTAKTIVIAGGGPVGVETAGELAEYLNGSPGWFSFPAKKARVVVVTSASKLLPVMRNQAAERAEASLRGLGVEVIYNTKVLGEKDGEVKLANGEAIKTDIYIPAIGTVPNSQFLDRELVNERGYIVTNPTTLRVEKAGTRTYAIGDVSSSSPGGIFHIMNQIPVLATNLKRDLLAASLGKEGDMSGRDREFVVDERASQFVPVGRGKGVGELMGWWVPSFLVWLIKGRDYMLARAKGNVDGGIIGGESKWKYEV